MDKEQTKQTKIIGALSPYARQLVDRAMNACAKEGYAVWGFVFAHQPAAERMLGDGKDFTCMEIVNNAGVDSLPMFIHKTEKALMVLRSQQPENFDIQAQFNRVVEETNAINPTPKKTEIIQ